MRGRAIVWGMAAVFGMGMGMGGAARAEDKPKHAAVTPTGRVAEKRWRELHASFVDIAKKGEAELIFLGDSITESWQSAGERDGRKIGGRNVWDAEFKNYKAANFGISGDRTQHVLWRLQNGELEGLKPKLIVLMIGTNNSNGNDHTAEEIADGVAAIVAEIRKQTSNAKVLLLGVFPRGKQPDSPQRKKLAQVNQLIAKLDDGKMVHFCDIGDKFLEKDGSISQDVMYDYLHLTEKGYQIWADAIRDRVKEMMK